MGRRYAGGWALKSLEIRSRLLGRFVETVAQHPGAQAIIFGGNEFREPEAITWDCFHQMLQGSAQCMAGSSVPQGTASDLNSSSLRSSHVQWERGAEGCSVAARLPEACQTSRSLSLFCWVAPLWGLGPFLSLLRLAPTVELGRSCRASGSVLEGVAAFTGR